jgi:hypothetical protein
MLGKGLARLPYVGACLALLLVAFGVGVLASKPLVEPILWCLYIPLFLITSLRFINLGVSWAYALCLFLPFIGLGTFIVCLFYAPAFWPNAKRASASAHIIRWGLASVAAAFVFVIVISVLIAFFNQAYHTHY